MTSRLADRLKTETSGLHTKAERTDFMAALLRGRMDRGAYVALLGNLHAVYDALEHALRRHAGLPAVALFDLAALARTQPLADDMAALAEGPAPDADIVPACRDYLVRIAQLDAAQPELLLAHAYVRYLGDLSGGQMLRRIVQRSMALPDARGSAFYDFGDPAETALLTSRFRAAVDALQVDEDAFVTEATSAFERHCRMFDQLAAAHGVGPRPAAND